MTRTEKQQMLKIMSDIFRMYDLEDALDKEDYDKFIQENFITCFESKKEYREWIDGNITKNMKPLFLRRLDKKSLFLRRLAMFAFMMGKCLGEGIAENRMVEENNEDDAEDFLEDNYLSHNNADWWKKL
jgi:hypothetical protein